MATVAIPVQNLGDGQQWPLISCVMPTHNRRDFALQAVRYFQRQDWPQRELIVIDDGTDGLERFLPADPRVRHVRLARKQSLGIKRNLGCELARGSVIAHWDDDDWYGANRLSLQARPLIDGSAVITGLTAKLFFELNTAEFWTCSGQLHRRLFAHDVAAGTLLFHRHVWEQLARYPDRSLAEDAHFLRHAVRRGATLRQVSGEHCFAYVRHGANTWRFACGNSFSRHDWSRVSAPAWPAVDYDFYSLRRRAT